jgi:hypothetical protein
MNKIVRLFLILLGAVLILGYVGMEVMKKRTKRHSPETTATVTHGGNTFTVVYSAPFKKGRRIFGALVPYGEVWRTGANEATTFTASGDFTFGGTAVKAGTYTLWTIPGAAEWKVILNAKRYGWGVQWGGVASREAEHDAAVATVPVGMPVAPVEQFTIRFATDPLHLVLEWDDVMVAVPIGQ